MPIDLSPAAAIVARLRRELEQRLKELNDAPVYLKTQHARYCTAAVFELFDAQLSFNQGVVGALDQLHRELASRSSA